MVLVSRTEIKWFLGGEEGENCEVEGLWKSVIVKTLMTGLIVDSGVSESLVLITSFRWKVSSVG